MDPITMIVSALVAGATAKAKDVASTFVSDAYNGLKELVVRKLGKGGAVQSVEEEPESDLAQATLIEALNKKQLAADEELKALAAKLNEAIAAAKSAGVTGAGDIDIETVRGRVNATVTKLAADGRIKLGAVVAETGNAEVSDLRAGPTATSKNP